MFSNKRSDPHRFGPQPVLDIEPAPKTVSQATVASMAALYEHLFRGRRQFSNPLLDITKLSNALYGMGFDRPFLDKCEYSYAWAFSLLFPALHDGNFYTDGRGHLSLRSIRGQSALLGFATFLCGYFADHTYLRIEMSDALFLQSLANDGFEFVDRTLVEVDVDTSTPAEAGSLPKTESLLKDLSAELRRTEPVAILFLDLDHFKLVNDQFGHTEGNNCLRTVVQTITRALLRKGKLYRVGGDEEIARNSVES